MADIQTMFKELQEALKGSLYEEDQEKFSRLANNVLGLDASESEKSDFRGQVKEQYMRIKAFNEKDDPKVGQVDP